eukprot:s3123_g8.t3
MLLRLAEDEDAVPVIATLFYRTRDYLNQEFWEDQIRRLGDIVAEEYFSHSRGIQLMVHHAPASALGLEVGEHRLLTEVEAMFFVGPQLGRRNISEERAAPRINQERRLALQVSNLHNCQHQMDVPPSDRRNSFTVVQEATPRLNRCELYVPGTQAKIIPKAAKSAADVVEPGQHSFGQKWLSSFGVEVVMDLEDSVAIGEKEEVDFGNKTVAVRINGLYSHHMYRDVVDIIEQAGERCDMFVIPMVGNGKEHAALTCAVVGGHASVIGRFASSEQQTSREDVYMADSLVSQVEEFMGRKKKIGFGLIIEATLGMMNIHEIAAASKRNEIVVAARANGLRPVDGPFGDIADPDGYKAQCERGAALGMEGKWAIHPSQVALANEVFSPGEAEVKQARRLFPATRTTAVAQGLGAVSLDGKLVDIASIKQADAIIILRSTSCVGVVPHGLSRPFYSAAGGEADVGLATHGEDQLLRERHALFHRFVFDHYEAPQPVPLPRGDYVLRVGGRPVCGLSVLGLQPWRLVCGGAWADEGWEPELACLAQQLRRRARKYACSIVYDSKDERSFGLLTGSNGKEFGLVRRQQSLKIAVTGVPVGLSPEQQARLARAPFLVPCEFLPFHAGRVVLV